MYTIGIDAGQTHLEIVFIDKVGNIVASGIGGPSHIQGKPMDDVFNQALNEALEHIPQSALRMEISCIGVGVTGIGIPGKRESILKVLNLKFKNIPVYMDNDAVTCHWGATKGEDGISILAGTGSIAYGKRLDNIFKLGGYGYLFGDGGSGFWIGRNAIARTLASTDGYDLPTSLEKVINKHFRIENIKQLPGEIYKKGNIPVKDIAALAKGVSLEAKNGDPLAIDIFNQAGLELSKLATTLLNLLEIHSDESFPIYCLGAVWNSGDILSHSFYRAVKKEFSNLEFHYGTGNPAVGAALLAQNKLRKSGSVS